MLTAYRLLTRFIHMATYPVTRFRAARGQQMWRDRLGLNTDDTPTDIWLHAASVGEVTVLSHLCKYLLNQAPNVRIYLTVITSQGFQAARRLLPETVAVRFLPADTTTVVARVLDRIHPGCLVIAETEIWPNLITLASSRGIAVILVNGRMSDAGFKRYRFIGSFLRQLLASYDRFFFKSDLDARRYRHFGVPEAKYQVVGDMKFDAPLWPRSDERIARIRAELDAAAEDFVIVAGSTRSGEETLLLDMISSLRREDSRYRLVIAPRHIERLEEVRQTCRDSGIEPAIYGNPVSGAPVVIVDRMGLLMDLYMAADLAFVGGTLVDIGGHNILEPVWAGTPVLYGPSLGNVADAAEYIESHNYGARVADSAALTDTVRAVRTGRLSFARKTEHDLKQSAVAVTAEYVLAKLNHA